MKSLRLAAIFSFLALLLWACFALPAEPAEKRALEDLVFPGTNDAPLQETDGMTAEQCRFKPGYYERKLGPPVGTIRFEIGAFTLNAHRVVNRYFVTNRLEWTGPCTYRLITIKVHDPILEGEDWPGNVTEYRIVAVQGNRYISRTLEDGSLRWYDYVQPEVPWKK